MNAKPEIPKKPHRIPPLPTKRSSQRHYSAPTGDHVDHQQQRSSEDEPPAANTNTSNKDSNWNSNCLKQHLEQIIHNNHTKPPSLAKRLYCVRTEESGGQRNCISLDEHRFQRDQKFANEIKSKCRQVQIIEKLPPQLHYVRISQMLPAVRLIPINV